MRKRHLFYVSAGGFTLIELLTVIAIIAILAGIMIPVVSHVRKNARSAQCVSNMKQLGVGLQLWLIDHKNVMPPDKVTKDADGNDLPDWPGWYSNTYLGQYFNMPWPKNVIGNVKRRVPWCPEIERSGEYALTSWAATGYGYNANFSKIRVPSSIEPSRLVVFWEDIQKTDGYTNYYSGFPTVTGSGGSYYKFAFRHNNTGHFLFLDGHVETVKPGPTGKAADYPRYTWNK